MAANVWVAIVPIFFNGLRAYNPGDVVPDANVALYGYDTKGWVQQVTVPDPGGAPADPFDARTAALLGDPASKTGAAGAAAYLPKWKPATVYAGNDLALSPSGQVVKANTAFTSGATFDATKWTVVAGGPGGGSSSASDLTSGTLDPARIADGTLPAAKLAGQLADGQIPAGIARDSEVATAFAGAVPSTENVPPGSTITVVKSGSAWPSRPTSRADVVVAWKGPDPSPPIVSSGNGGMLDNVDYRLVTP